VKAIIGKQHHPEALSVLLQRCEETGVRRFSQCRDLSRFDRTPWPASARECGDRYCGRGESFYFTRGDSFGTGNRQPSWPLELVANEPEILLDGAHNPAGAEALRDYLIEFGRRPLTIVFAAMGDKQLDRIGQTLFPLADNLILTTLDNLRAARSRLSKQSPRIRHRIHHEIQNNSLTLLSPRAASRLRRV
jgi:folylpolyglutamate synthase/dihydropteroate synthase